MNAGHWARVKEIFGEVIAADPSSREAILDARCAGDPALRAEVTGFVEVHVDAPADVCTERVGVADPHYEEPIAPDLRVPTHDRDERASTAQLLSYVESRLDPA